MSDSNAEFKLRQEIRSYENHNYWEGDEVSKLPTKQAITDLLAFLDNRPADIPLPQPEVDRDGEVGVFWAFREIQVFAEVVLDGDGTYACFAVRGRPTARVEDFGQDGNDVNGPWPEGLLRILRYQADPK